MVTVAVRPPSCFFSDGSDGYGGNVLNFGRIVAEKKEQVR
jgi:hypothetical protein